MAEYIKGIKTASGIKQIDYEALANKPAKFTSFSVNGNVIKATNENDTIALAAGNNIELQSSAKSIEIKTPLTVENVTQQAISNINNNMLSTETKALYGLDDSAVIDDILQELCPRVGTIQYTVRDDLDEQWIECDGRAIFEDEYPELYSFLTTKEPVEVQMYSNSTSKYVSSPNYINGYYVFCLGYRSSDGNTYIYYSKNITGPYESAIIMDHDHEYVTDIAYNNGMYVASCAGYNSDYGSVFVSTDLGGPWVESSQMFYYSLYSIKYINNMWIALARSTIYTTTDPQGKWTRVKTFDDLSYITIAYGNGYYVISGHDNFIYITPDLPSSTWTKKIITTTRGWLSNAIYIDGHWEIGFDADGESQTNFIYTSVDLVGNWAKTELTLTDFEIRGIKYVFGHQIITGNSGQYIRNSSGEYEKICSINSLSTIVDKLRRLCIFYEKNGAACTCIYINSRALPDLTLDGAHAYIRAK